ncbi:2-amino-3-ketobutyrate coenzyme A ligase [Sinomonas cellulolyticus]|uniref:2-amino-3-ketobutyrate coenzyme A ligase n=1 Tax=Sinomonas cellulolyticus TaxID=2801916 RepID=A0ABS1K0C2_9MICC|nr:MULTISPECIES: glycine C-acetyltransferase [Sinomonas]MBL0704352.1 glycine C-acetyltransferase [Sinomonas cellulolyticus]GHG48165.1 2-amino-3-ketobutyrate coenzyme A ligase [Sinomonas sp. KCTC 49339]
MFAGVKEQLAAELDEIRAAGTFKEERHIDSPQSAHIEAGPLGAPAGEVLNFCANNYLGLADHPDLIASAKRALDERGFGMASVRFICGTQDAHLALERRVSEFLGTEDTILFSSCFDANGGVFEALLGPEDAVISDALNHASIIDGIRLCKAARLRYANRDMAELEARLQEARQMHDGAGARRVLVVTDGVFSMDGYLAPLRQICDLAERYGAMVMVDDSHAVGFMGARGAGTPEHAGVSDRVDIYTGTFGKALGGASGGYVSGRAEIVAMLRQKARPYLFSNSVAPAIVAATMTALDLVAGSADLRERLFENAALFRKRMGEEGFEVLPGEHAIVPVMFGDAALAARIATEMLAHGVYVTAFSYPVVPRGQARIRVQLSAAHTAEDVEAAVKAFAAAREAVSAGA